MQTIIVKNCNNCPFAEANFNSESILKYANCLHPISGDRPYIIDSYWKNYKSPKWCALKKEELIIKFK